MFRRLDLLLSANLPGDTLCAEWLMPALIAAAASNDGERGEGGLLRKGSNWLALVMERRLGRAWIGEVEIELEREGGSEFKSGGILYVSQSLSE